MYQSLSAEIGKNFLGNSSKWYKVVIIVFLIINPLILFSVNHYYQLAPFALYGKFVASWFLLLEFIFTLAMALKCYPLQPGGLLMLEALFLNLTSTDVFFQELKSHFSVILLLMFMVAGIYFMRDLLLYLFTHLLIKIKNKMMLSFLFCFTSAILSAFLDALTVTAVIIAVGEGFYNIYHKVVSKEGAQLDKTEEEKEELRGFRNFLRTLLMHSVVGTALGGVLTIVGEPQNLLIATEMQWDFKAFFLHMLPVTLPALIMGLITCVLLEKLKWFNYGASLSFKIRKIIAQHGFPKEIGTANYKAKLIVQSLIGIWLIIALSLHLAEVGLIGLSIIVLLTSFTGVTEENALGHAFKEALPFTALLSVFFGIVSVIISQNVFSPIMDYVLSLEGSMRIYMFYFANGLLSIISNNMFSATIFMEQAMQASALGQITDKELQSIAVAINVGTNLPSVATPNGQAAFLFLLSSALAPLVRLSYLRMVWMALPYALVLGLVCFIALHWII